MHYYGESNVDWDGINNAAEYIGEALKCFGRMNVTQYKEKYGTVRCYCVFGWYNLLNITHPGYIAYWKYPNWLMDLDFKLFRKVIPFLNFMVIPYQKWLYRFVYKQMVKKYPHLKNEILWAADYPELLNNI